MDAKPDPTRSQVEAIIAERIAADPAFRDTLLADPRAVLSEVVGFDIPESVQVVLHEESLTQIHLTIPASENLSDADLELVAGAGGWDSDGGRILGPCYPFDDATTMGPLANAPTAVKMDEHIADATRRVRG